MTRTLRPLAAVALAVVTIVAGGCGKDGARASGGGSTSSTVATSQGVQFAQCMRDHGVKNFPDPDPSGQMTIDGVVNGSSIDPGSPTFKQALDACKDLEPAGFTGHRRTAEQQQAALAFAQCMRDNGVKDFPDPTPDSPLVDTTKIPSSSRSGGMTALNAAMRKCRDFSGPAGVTSGR